jgi:uncharacterized protein YgbK (DUF1537 family)
MIFGAIADDYTGGSDLSGMLFEQGVRVVQTFGPPEAALLEGIAARCDAVTICLKSRSIEPEQACRLSLAALEQLRALGARQVQFKYCSTFDSTERGNIGPVAEALLDRLGSAITVAVPALPVNGRTQYLGHLFVNGHLLSESPMRHHPVNPMTDSNLVRFLQTQMRGRAGLVTLPVVQQGAPAIRAELDRLGSGGVRVALVDAVSDQDLAHIADAVAELRLITGGSGITMHLPAQWKQRRWLAKNGPESDGLRVTLSGVAILAGSCSAATRRQLRALDGVIGVDVPRLLTGGTTEELDRLQQAALRALRERGLAAVASSAAPEDQLHAAAQIENMFGQLASRLVNESGVRRLIVAGGETSGAVIGALGIRAVEITGIIDPGVPALRSLGEPALRLALKSGNFGSDDFFVKTVRLFQQS